MGNCNIFSVCAPCSFILVIRCRVNKQSVLMCIGCQVVLQRSTHCSLQWVTTILWQRLRILQLFVCCLRGPQPLKPDSWRLGYHPKSLARVALSASRGLCLFRPSCLSGKRETVHNKLLPEGTFHTAKTFPLILLAIFLYLPLAWRVLLEVSELAKWWWWCTFSYSLGEPSRPALWSRNW